ncbi:zinc-binding dehydrogenase [Actinacidiphila oryziradicis]|uniref:zinc-binding dehydrogenase n=1 Tax=Actinacidiphila oryziradicis TaxID=2571141 RepID=UPI0023F3A116|nr:zinc-binding dehydrogenase [Actinacidiphila oryziradicis]MCW2874548.1 L-iditol 2-dehydrogenase [Actinacidiphila oryziradicis]
MSVGRIAYMPSPGKIELREYELPQVAAGDLLIEVLASGICGSDVHMFADEHPLKSLALGHEMVGRIVDPTTRPYDTAGVPLAAGDRVTVSYFQACMACQPCARGEVEMCLHAYDNWISSPDEAPHFNGMHGTHYYVRRTQALFRVPDEVPTLVAATANCALAQVTAGVDRAGVATGDAVVVLGAGGLGLYCTAICRERGATVVVVDAVPSRLELARSFGASHTVSLQDYPDAQARVAAVRELTGGGADTAFELAGVPAAVQEAISMARIGGQVIEIGNIMPGLVTPIDVGDITRRKVSVLPVIRYRPDHLQEAIRFLQRNIGAVPFEKLVDATYPFDQVEVALQDSQNRRVARAILTLGAE